MRAPQPPLGPDVEGPETLGAQIVLPHQTHALEFMQIDPEVDGFTRKPAVFVPMKTLSHVTAARFTQIDYDREMALILTEPGIAGTTEIYGIVRIIADPDDERAEYAIIVRHDMTGMGLGVFLMRCILDYAQRRGIREIYGDVLQENRAMLKRCKVLGFKESRSPDEMDIVRVTLNIENEGSN
jgi:acetyltransferase